MTDRPHMSYNQIKQKSNKTENRKRAAAVIMTPAWRQPWRGWPRRTLDAWHPRTKRERRRPPMLVGGSSLMSPHRDAAPGGIEEAEGTGRKPSSPWSLWWCRRSRGRPGTSANGRDLQHGRGLIHAVEGSWRWWLLGGGERGDHRKALELHSGARGGAERRQWWLAGVRVWPAPLQRGGERGRRRT
jgi:hypothetical protein